jgi:hypothetical protein
MEAADAPQVNGVDSAGTAEEQLANVFGSHRAEWLREELFELFSEPFYFPELLTPRPCVLIGGRGTGKTTVLRCLSYEGRFALDQRRSERIAGWPYYGFYFRVDTNKVTAFQGPEVSGIEWNRLFAHYLNLEFSELVLEFLFWYRGHSPDLPRLPLTACRRIALSLHLPGADEVKSDEELREALSDARLLFEAYINNIVDEPRPRLSMQGAPLQILFREFEKLGLFHQKSFFFLVDEYENFLDYQQQIVNTLIKHAATHYTFKIGVRELGWRVRTTLNPNEQLISPADYRRIHIVEELADQFPEFALAVCNARLARIQTTSSSRGIQDVSALLPSLAIEEEALLLDDRERMSEIVKQAEALVPAASRARLLELHPLELYFAHEWALEKNLAFADVLAEMLENASTWSHRYENYKYSLLFTLRKGKRGIRKYYAGWRVFTHLSAGNIRYLLELVDRSLLLHFREGLTITESVSPKIQTEAAQYVGRKNLTELEGLAVNGARLTKLLLGLGRVFGVMAEQPLGHAPEANQFEIRAREAPAGDAANATTEVEEILNAAVMHLALLRFPGSKLQDPTDTRDYDYMVHPVFSPFFVFSYRRKRKIGVSAEDLLGLIEQPKRTIATVLTQQNRVEEEPLPEQLLLFQGYYAGGT